MTILFKQCIIIKVSCKLIKKCGFNIYIHIIFGLIIQENTEVIIIHYVYFTLFVIFCSDSTCVIKYLYGYIISHITTIKI